VVPVKAPLPAEAGSRVVDRDEGLRETSMAALARSVVVATRRPYTSVLRWLS